VAFALHITAVDSENEVRVVELEGHPFFIATLFQPERSAFKGTPTAQSLFTDDGGGAWGVMFSTSWSLLLTNLTGEGALMLWVHLDLLLHEMQST
jgi:hypothetical protein